MPKLIALVGAKGGTLKTATAAALAHQLAAAGLRTVMADLDPQGDLTTRSGFSRLDIPLEAEAVPVRFPGEMELSLWLLRGGRPLEGADAGTIRRHIERCSEMDPDVVVVDTPPALGVLTTTAVRMADLVLVPAVPGKESLLRIHDVITVTRAVDPAPVVRVLVTMANTQTNLYRWMAGQVDELYPKLRLPMVVPFEAAAGEAGVFDLPVTISAPQSRCASAYTELAVAVLQQMRLERRPVRAEVSA